MYFHDFGTFEAAWPVKKVCCEIGDFATEPDFFARRVRPVAANGGGEPALPGLKNGEYFWVKAQSVGVDGTIIVQAKLADVPAQKQIDQQVKEIYVISEGFLIFLSLYCGIIMYL